ncbi:MAG: integral rane protein linked to a cation pump [Candidatus Midichloriaceae bacterium]|jgi:nitrogen fixation protein FixH|nr:integral rane protein linked to a cation pump [Candidatus Midichloriaceae bacterium]
MQKNNHYIPTLIVCFIIFFTLIIIGFFYIAQSTFTGEVTEKAYQKGLDFGKIYQTSLMQPDKSVLAEISIINGKVILKLNTTFENFNLEGKIVKPVSFEHDVPLNFEKNSSAKFYEAIFPPLTPGNWEIRVKVVAGGEDYVFNKRFLKQ